MTSETQTKNVYAFSEGRTTKNTCPHVERRAGDGLLELAPAQDLSKGGRLAGRRKLVGHSVEFPCVVRDGDLLPILETFASFWERPNLGAPAVWQRLEGTDTSKCGT